MKKYSVKILSLLILNSILVSLFTVFPFADSADESSEAPVVYFNREFEEGWNYTNGLVTDHKNQLDATLTYTKMSSSWYNYYLVLSSNGDNGGYLTLDLSDCSPSEGKLFFELEFKSLTSDNNIGGMIMIADRNGTGMSHLVTAKDGVLYLLGKSAGAIPTSFTELSFVIDFDYAEHTEGAEDNQYLISICYCGKTYERVYTTEGDFGISGIYIGAAENLFSFDRSDDKYAIDNVRLYSGIDEKAKLDSAVYGSLVDENAARDFVVVRSDSSAYLSGQPDIERLPAGDRSVNVHYNRYFGEGWDFDNGFTAYSVSSTLRGNDFEIAAEYSSDVNKGESGFLNYYFKFTQRNSYNGFACLDTAEVAPRTGKTYIEFDIKASVGANIPTIIGLLTQGTPYLEFTLASITNGNLYILDKNFGELGEEWCHVIIEMDLDWGPNKGDGSAIRFTATVGENMVSISVVKNIPASTADTSSFRGLRQLRIGRLGTMTQGSEGDWFGMDNLQVYSSISGPATLDVNNYGSLVDSTKPKYYPSGDGANVEISIAQIVDSSLNMKVGSVNALLYGEKTYLFTDSDGLGYGAPYKAGGKVMVPIDPILKYVNSPYRYNSGGYGCDIYVGNEYRSVAAGRSDILIGGIKHQLSATPTMKDADGHKVLYIALDDVELIFNGYYVTYDEVGFISIATVDDYLDRNVDEEFMRSVMKRFVYDEIDPGEVYERAKAFTNNFDHPYIYATQDRFNYLYNVYHSEPTDKIYDPDLYSYIETSVVYADGYMSKWADLDSDGNYVGTKIGKWYYNGQGMASWVPYDVKASASLTPEEADNHPVSIAPYEKSAGYDPAGGRLNVLSDGEGCLAAATEAVAFAYQMTRDEKYARFAYEWTYQLCQWTHWGPGHYLNVANTARYLSITYDFLYDAWIELGLDPAPIRDNLYRLCTYTAWRSLNGLSTEYKNSNGTESIAYWKHIGNWNPVCASGVLPSSLISFENPEYIEKAAFTISKTIYYLGQNGFNYFAFDGSYRESSGYWCATIKFSQYCILTVQNALGDDLGLGNAPGMDISNYFGSHAESNDFVSWNYHDDWIRNMPSDWYYLAAQLFDNPEFAALRYMHIQNGKEPYRWDALWYDKEMIEAGNVNLPLDYVMTSIDGTISRASWERGDLYVGILGGINNVAHGQYDSGNWIYENAGVRWFVDLGADDYNLYGGGLGKGYYRYSAEGNNTVAISSLSSLLPHGQSLTNGGVLTSAIVNEYGSASIIDQSSVYGGSNYVFYARRGMLLTNNRSTVVIQDEISLVSKQDLYWFAHYDTTKVQFVELSEDGRTAYMTSRINGNGESHTLRVSLLSSNEDLKFQIWDAYTYVLETPEFDYSKKMNGIAEGNRDNFKKLVIEASGVTRLDVAVVIELIDKDDPIELGYTLNRDANNLTLPLMSSWIPSKDTRAPAAVTQPEEEEKQSASMYKMIVSTQTLNKIMELGDPFGEDLGEFVQLMYYIEYALSIYGREHTDNEVLNSIAIYDAAREMYEKYTVHASRISSVVSSIAAGLIGIEE